MSLYSQCRITNDPKSILRANEGVAMIISEVLMYLPKHFPADLSDEESISALMTLSERMITVDVKTFAKMEECYNALDGIIANGIPSTKKRGPRQPNKPPLEVLPIPKHKSRGPGQQSVIQHTLLRLNNEVCLRRSKKDGLPNIVCGFFDVPTTPHDVLDEIIEAYEKIDLDPSVTYRKSPKTYVLWSVLYLVRKGRLVRVAQ